MTKKPISRRDFLRLVTAGAAGGVLAACAPTQEEPTTEPAAEEEQPAGEPAAEEGALVRYWTGWAVTGAERPGKRC
jgi:hypothetical protein